MKPSYCTSTLLAFLVVLLSSVAGPCGEIYVTNGGSYYVRGDGPRITKTDTVKDAYYFRGEENWHVIKRMGWELSTKADLTDGEKTVEFTGYSQDLLIQKLDTSNHKDCELTPGPPTVLYTNRTKINKWLTEEFDTSHSLLADYPDFGHFINSDVYPAYLGSKLISVLEVYTSYAGGAHGISGFKFRTYTSGGLELRVKDLFSDWRDVKDLLLSSLMEKWVKKSDTLSEENPQGQTDVYHLEEAVREMGKELEKHLEENLGSEPFIFTLSGEGIRFNLFFPPYSIGPYVMGGSWLSLPVSEMSGAVKEDIEGWVEKHDTSRPLPDRIGYLGQKTQLYGIAPAPEQFTRGFSLP